MRPANAGKFHMMSFAVIVLLVMITDIILFERIGTFSRKTFDTSIRLSSAESVVSTMKISEKDTPKSEKASPNGSVSKGGEGSSASGDKQIMSGSASIELFKAEYKNGESTITAKSLNGEKIIAPGTENSYTFSVINDAETAMNYSLKAKAVMSDGENEIYIPIEVKLYNYKGEYLTGTQDEWAEADALNSVDHNAVLGSDRYENFTLDWKWDYEAGRDDLDTALGNLAAEKPITCKIQIDVLASDSDIPNSDQGIPNTGGGFSLKNFGIIVISLLIIVFGYSVLSRKVSGAENEE